VPEGDTIFRAARTLNRALSGHKVTRFETVLPQLSRIDHDSPIAGRTVESVTPQGKWMLMRFSGDLTLLTHMRMNGSWHIYRPGEAWRRGRHHMRVMIETAEFVAVAFDVAVAEFHNSASLARHPGLTRLGPDVLDDTFDPAEAANRLRELSELTVGEALLRQSTVAGIGNVFKSEICFVCRVNPFRDVSSLGDAELLCLTTRAQEYLRDNVADASGSGINNYAGFRRTTRRSDPGARLWVYGRKNQPCRRCGRPIQSRKQGESARVTFWCPVCQPVTPTLNQ
jgi:endonuclease VIII